MLSFSEDTRPLWLRRRRILRRDASSSEQESRKQGEELRRQFRKWLTAAERAAGSTSCWTNHAIKVALSSESWFILTLFAHFTWRKVRKMCFALLTMISLRESLCEKEHDSRGNPPNLKPTRRSWVAAVTTCTWLSLPFPSTRSSSISRVPRYRTFTPRRCSAAVRLRPSIGISMWSRKSFSYQKHMGCIRVDLIIIIIVIILDSYKMILTTAGIWWDSRKAATSHSSSLCSWAWATHSEGNWTTATSIQEMRISNSWERGIKKEYLKHIWMQRSHQPNAARQESISVLLIYSRFRWNQDYLWNKHQDWSGCQSRIHSQSRQPYKLS